MKFKITLILLSCFIVLLTISCKQRIKEVKGQKYQITIKNLKTAYTNEITTSKKCLLLSQKAKEIGLTDVALLYKAASISEGIHGANFKSVLTRLGVLPDEKIQDIKFGSMEEELKNSFIGEAEELSEIYPEYIKIAKEEGADDAKNYFEYAWNTEKKHNTMFENPMNSYGRNSEINPKAFYICSNCGFTFDEASVTSSCPSCKTTKDKYILVNKP